MKMQTEDRHPLRTQRGPNGKNPLAIFNYWLTEELVPERHL